jgi:hypothetical protein
VTGAVPLLSKRYEIRDDDAARLALHGRLLASPALQCSMFSRVGQYGTLGPRVAKRRGLHGRVFVSARVNAWLSEQLPRTSGLSSQVGFPG